MKNIEKSRNGGAAIKILRLAFPALALLLLGVWFGKGFHNVLALRGADEFPSATVLDVPVPLPDFLLTDSNRKEFSPLNLRRKWTFIFFGYTHCPDVCPTALVDLNNIYHNLLERGDLANTQFVFVSVDPV